MKKNKLVKNIKKVIRHEIDADLVKKTIDAKVAEYEKSKEKDKEEHKKTLESYAKDRMKGTTKHWMKIPSTQRKENERIEKMYDSWITREREHYALVRVIEDCEKASNEKRFHLVYGTDPDEAKGTGPFMTIEEAKDWFLKQGR